MPLLIVVLVVQAALLAWTWLARAPVFEADSAPLVIVTSDPSGAPVVVDGLPRGQTPLRIVLNAGKHQLQVGPDGSASTQWMDVAPGAFSTLHVVQASGPAASAEREGGVLEITTEPAGLSVQVDGTPRGISPIAISDLAPGVHEVTVMRGTRRVTRAVSVDAGVPTAVLISTVGEAGVPSGWLTVTGPVPLQILEDGTLVGSTDSPRLLLPTGRHQLDFVNDTFGYRERRAVDIVPGQTAAVAMAAATGTLSVNAQPWGEVWIDGTHVGETPIGNLSLPIGNHELVVRHPQLGEQRRTIPIRVNTPSRVGVDLRQ
jgi:hypothetical protein